jgi:hypothetical protein
MGNLDEAKQVLEENKNLEAVLNPQMAKKRIKLPLQRDVNLIQSILDKKLEARESKFKERKLKDIKDKYKKEIEAIHVKAIALRKDAEKISKLIETESSGNIKAKFLHDNYGSGYWNELPEDMDQATSDEIFEVDGDSFPELMEIKKEMEEFLLNVKIGMAPLADVKPLLEKIDKILL